MRLRKRASRTFVRAASLDLEWKLDDERCEGECYEPLFVITARSSPSARDKRSPWRWVVTSAIHDNHITFGNRIDRGRYRTRAEALEVGDAWVTAATEAAWQWLEDRGKSTS